MLVDTHAHLDSVQFDGDREGVIARALTAGIGAMVTVGTNLDSSRQAIALAKKYPHVYASLGIHPHETAQAGPDALAELERLSREDTVVAIGETGLDFYRNWSPREKQRELFIAQLELARHINKPAVIHDREAHTETLSILRNQGRNLRGVLHCFSGGYDIAVQAIKMGFFLGFDGPLTFQNARKLQELVRELPLECILIETDCPYLAPHPHRGQRNEPAYVRLIAAKIAELKGVPIEQVAEVTTANARRLFGLTLPLPLGTGQA